MKNLAMSQVMDGANFWDAPGHSMAGSNDKATRTEIFQWIEKNEKILYSPRLPMHPVGVYFSPKSRDYDPGGFLPSYRGVLVMLLQSHLEFQVISPKTLAEFHGQVLVLPNVTVLTDAEKRSLKRLAENGTRLVITGHNATGLAGSGQIVSLENCPASLYLGKLGKNFLAGSQDMPGEFVTLMKVKSDIRIEAPPTVAVNFAQVNGTPHLFFANFSGLVPGKITTPSAVSGSKVSIPAGMGNSLAYLPFLGQTQILHGTKHGDTMQFELPPIERGAVAWVVGN